MARDQRHCAKNSKKTLVLGDRCLPAGRRVGRPSADGSGRNSRTRRPAQSSSSMQIVARRSQNGSPHFAAQPPFAPEIQERLDRIMPKGIPPLALFTTLARDKRLFERFMAGGLLDPGHLSLRQREIVIDRITALSGSEYEWGVHITIFAARAGLTEAQIRSNTTADAMSQPGLTRIGYS